MLSRRVMTSRASSVTRTLLREGSALKSNDASSFVAGNENENN
jgi:hypothetical protein